MPIAMGQQERTHCSTSLQRAALFESTLNLPVMTRTNLLFYVSATMDRLLNSLGPPAPPCQCPHSYKHATESKTMNTKQQTAAFITSTCDEQQYPCLCAAQGSATPCTLCMCACMLSMVSVRQHSVDPQSHAAHVVAVLQSIAAAPSDASCRHTCKHKR